MVRFMGGVALAIGVASFVGPSVGAETVLVSSEPADGAEIIVSPSQIVATFSAAVLNSSVLQAVCNEAPAPLGTVTVGLDGVSLVAPVVGVLPPGTCNVSYSLPQADGKVATGTFSFRVLDPTTDAGTGSNASDTAGNATDAPPVSGPLGLARLVSYLALAALFGGAVLIVLYWPEGIDYDVTRNYFRMAWVLSMISTYFTAVLRASLISGRSVTETLSPFGWADLFDNLSGISILARVALVGASVIVMMRPESLLDPQSQTLSLALPGAAVFTFAFTRTEDDFSLVGVAAGGVHNLAVAVWLGGLILLARTVLIAPGDEDLVQALRGFSRLVTPLIVIASASGLVHLWQLDGGDILSSRHGRLIVLKILAVGAMIYIGGAARHYIANNLARRRQLSGKAATRLRSAVLMEIGFGALALLITAWAVATLPVKIPPPGADRTKYVFVSTRSGGALDVQIRIGPAAVGPNAVRIDVFSPEAELSNLVVRFNPPTQNSPGITLTVPLNGAGGALLPLAEGIPFGEPGLWTITVTANGPSGPLPPANFTVEVTSNGLEPLDTGPGAVTSIAVSDGSTTVTSVVPLPTTTLPNSDNIIVGGDALATTTTTSLP
ncbi:MAG: copper resistance CopC/CopD family protein [Ilumatobacteraceae bacterium]